MIKWRMRVGLAMAAFLPCLAVEAQDGRIRGATSVPAAGITEIAVYLVATGERRPPIPAVHAVIDQRALDFVPRVVVVTPGSTVSFPNHDTMLHNVFHPGEDAFDLGTYPQGEERSHTFGREGAFVIFCSVHPEMVAYAVVVASAYRAVTGRDGRFVLENVAPGTYHLRTWHRRLAPLDEMVTVPANGTVDVNLALRYGRPGNPRTTEPRPSP